MGHELRSRKAHREQLALAVAPREQLTRLVPAPAQRRRVHAHAPQLGGAPVAGERALATAQVRRGQLLALPLAAQQFTFPFSSNN